MMIEQKNKSITLLILTFLFSFYQASMSAQISTNVSLSEDACLRHVPTGLYLCSGHKYTTQATVSTVPDKFRFDENPDGTYYLRNTNPADRYVGLSTVSLYVDLTRQDKWTLTRVDGTNHYILSHANGNLYVDGSGDCRLSDSFADEWELVNPSQLKENLNSATAENPIDASFLISNPNFYRVYSDVCWQGDPVLGGRNLADNNDNWVAEKFNCAFDVYQTLKDVPNGRYTVSVQGFYRNGGYADAATKRAAGTEQLVAYLFANNSRTPLMSIFDKSTKASLFQNDVNTTYGYVPNQMDGAAYYLSRGYYSHNSVDVIVKNHQLVIGVTKSELVANDWTLFDNFRITYHGPADDVIDDIPEASLDNPIDVTYLITNPDFRSSGGWLGGVEIKNYSVGSCASKKYANFDIYQIINDIPDGLYKVQANGFYRYGRYDSNGQYSYGGADNKVFALYTQDFATINRRNGTEKLYAKLYANNESVGIHSVFDFAHQTFTHTGDYESEFGFVPHSSEGTIEAFAAGEYENELFVYVTNGSLRLGVKKNAGYKDDWTAWGDFHLTYYGKADLVYADDIELPYESLTLAVGEKRKIEATALPLDASVKTFTYLSSSSGLTVSSDGTLSAKTAGTYTVRIICDGGAGIRTLNVNVINADGDAHNLLANEVQSANIDMFIDPSFNYGSWLELYNPTSTPVALTGLYITDDAAVPNKFRLKSGVVPANSFATIWFDHNDCDSRQVDFKLNTEGGSIYLYNTNGELLLSQDYPALAPRTSYARSTDGSGTWALTSNPTPGATNATSADFLPLLSSRLPMPVVEDDCQILTAPTTINIDIPEGATLVYTTDGSTPTLTNGTSTTAGSLLIEQNTVLRLRFFQTGLIPSPVATYSYIFRDKDYTLPILSVVSDPINFYDDEIGVFVPGTNGVVGGNVGNGIATNWQQNWERPVNMEYIDVDGTRLISQETDMERSGGWSRSWYPFSFKLKASKQYEGLNSIDYSFFPDDKPLNKHKALQIRNGGNDLLCRLKDAAMCQVIISSGLYVDALAYQPTHVFVNGVYQGMMNIREPSNKHFAYSNYGIDTDFVDQFEFRSGQTVKAGTIDRLKELRDLSANASNPDTYAEIRRRLDVDEFINYMAVQLYLGGDDWPTNNMKGFIDQNNGKLHLVLFDLDQTLRFDEQQISRMRSNTSNYACEIWTNLLNKNSEFRRQFVDAYSIVAGSVFDIPRAHRIINEVAERLDYPLSLEGLEPWTTANESTSILTESRKKLMMKALSNYSNFGVYGTTCQPVNLSSNIPDARILVNGQDVPTGEFNGYLYAPVTLTAKAPMGYEFTGWQDPTGTIVSTSPSYDMPSTGTIALTATYKALPANPVSVNEVSASNSINVNTDYWKKDDWVELYNMTDSPVDVAGMYLTDDASQPQKFHIPTNDIQQTVIAPHSHLVVWASKRSNIDKEIHTNFKLSNVDGQQVILTSADGSWQSTLTYSAHEGQESVGRYPDGGAEIYHLYQPTIHNPNTLTSYSDLLYLDTMVVPDREDQFRLELTEGWNWISHPLSYDILPSDITEGALTIMSQTDELFLDEKLGWTGSLATLSPYQSYRVNMLEDASHLFDAPFFNPADRIPLHKGWNWIGFPLLASQSLSQALSLFTPSEGDAIVGQNGFATYEQGAWSGSLEVLTPGAGYMYKSATPKSLNYSLPQSEQPLSAKARFRPQPSSPWSVNTSAHPHVMSIVARVVADGADAPAGAYSVAAFSDDDECRGIGKYIDGKLFITIYGEGNETIHFRAVDDATGLLHEVNEQFNFTPDIRGSRRAPLPLTIGAATDIASLHGNANIVSATFYTLDGITAASERSRLSRGIYIVKYVLVDGSVINQKVIIK